MLSWLSDFSWILGRSSSSSNSDILKINCNRRLCSCSFHKLLKQFSFIQVFSPKRHATECTSAIFAFLYVNRESPPPPHPYYFHTSPLTTATVKLASDLLGVGFELRSFCYLSTCQTGENRKSEDGGVSTCIMAGCELAPCNHQNYFEFAWCYSVWGGGLIYSSQVRWTAVSERVNWLYIPLEKVIYHATNLVIHFTFQYTFDRPQQCFTRYVFLLYINIKLIWMCCMSI